MRRGVCVLSVGRGWRPMWWFVLVVKSSPDPSENARGVQDPCAGKKKSSRLEVPIFVRRRARARERVARGRPPDSKKAPGPRAMRAVVPPVPGMAGETGRRADVSTRAPRRLERKGPLFCASGGCFVGGAWSA